MLRMLFGFAIGVCAVSALASPAPARQAGDAARLSRTFADSVGAYVTRQKDLGGSPAPLALRQGDIFTPEVTKEFRTIIRDAFRGPDGRNMRRTIEEGDTERVTALRVNVVYPEDIPLGTMPPMLLRRLPVLPMGLAYRIVGRALVLKDVKTNVIVDVIPDVIPRTR